MAWLCAPPGSRGRQGAKQPLELEIIAISMVEEPRPEALAEIAYGPVRDFIEEREQSLMFSDVLFADRDRAAGESPSLGRSLPRFVQTGLNLIEDLVFVPQMVDGCAAELLKSVDSLLCARPGFEQGAELIDQRNQATMF